MLTGLAVVSVVTFRLLSAAWDADGSDVGAIGIALAAAVAILLFAAGTAVLALFEHRSHTLSGR